jgi:SagB-type dehydrogenase family enzyme
MKASLINRLIINVILWVLIIIFPVKTGECKNGKIFPQTIKLPRPQYDSRSSVENTLLERRSVRTYSDEPLTLAEISQLLWAAQGVTHHRGFRTAPSAGALYPLEIYMVAAKVTGLATGIYKYKPGSHELLQVVEGDKRTDLCRAALNQSAVKNAPVIILFCAVYQRMTVKYGQRGIRYAFIEVGHSAQNICLQAVSLGLGTVPMGAFHDDKVKKLLNCEESEEPLYLMPVGKLKNK